MILDVWRSIDGRSHCNAHCNLADKGYAAGKIVTITTTWEQNGEIIEQTTRKLIPDNFEKCEERMTKLINF